MCLWCSLPGTSYAWPTFLSFRSEHRRPCSVAFSLKLLPPSITLPRVRRYCVSTGVLVASPFLHEPLTVMQVGPVSFCGPFSQDAVGPGSPQRVPGVGEQSRSQALGDPAGLAAAGLGEGSQGHFWYLVSRDQINAALDSYLWLFQLGGHCSFPNSWDVCQTHCHFCSQLCGLRQRHGFAERGSLSSRVGRVSLLLRSPAWLRSFPSPVSNACFFCIPGKATWGLLTETAG